MRNIPEILAVLEKEIEQIQAAILTLKQLQSARDTIGGSTGRRGRKFMPPEERKVVAERMRTYWATYWAKRRKEGSI